MTEPPLPEDGAKDSNQQQGRITIRDVIRAVFLPEREITSDDFAPSKNVSRALDAIASNLPSPEPQQPSILLDTPGVQTYPDTVMVVPSGPETKPWLVFSGILIAFGVILLGQITALGVSDSIISWVLFLLGGSLWAAVLVFQMLLEHRPLITRGPSVSGGGVSRPLQSVDRYDLVLRLTMLGGAIAFSAMTFVLSANNTFRTIGILTWAASILCVVLAFSERDVFTLSGDIASELSDLGNKLWQQRTFWRVSILIVIIGLGAFFRYYQLETTPPEMTSDHVEKLLDAYRISELGITSIFFINNGGREALHFYVVAWTANLFGTGWTFLTLKLVSAFWAMLLLPVIVLLGRELVDWETGLWAAGLLAISWWHTVLARLALRISLTPLVFTLVVICLIRGIRTGLRRAWIWAGLWMGVGVYSYQAMRLVPLVAMAACLITLAGFVFPLLLQKNRPHDILRTKALNTAARQVLNLTAAGIIAVVMFVPMLRVWVDFPQQLWNRVINRTTNNEAEIQGNAAIVLADNYYDAVRMYNFEGDQAWISSVPGQPALDLVTGALLIFGISVWLVRLWLRRDPADWFVLAAILLMLLPSALAIAFPTENPSTTRASGTLPLVIVLAAWPLSIIRQYTVRASTTRLFKGTTYGFLVLLLAGALTLNFDLYFNQYHQAYLQAAPYPRLLATGAQAALAETGTDPDNIDGVWLISYPFWQDHRAFGAELGDITFERVFIDSLDMANRLVTEPEIFDTRPLIFVFNQQDQRAQDVLEAVYPGGELELIEAEIAAQSYYVYVVP